MIISTIKPLVLQEFIWRQLDFLVALVDFLGIGYIPPQNKDLVKIVEDVYAHLYTWFRGNSSTQWWKKLEISKKILLEEIKNISSFKSFPIELLEQ
jgi:hypothetical protein